MEDENKCKIKNANLKVVIETNLIKGTGTEKDPVRNVFQYWDLGGHLLATNDPLNS